MDFICDCGERCHKARELLVTQRETLNTLYRTQLDIVQEQGWKIHKLQALVEDQAKAINFASAEISRLKEELNQAIQAATDWQNKLTEQRDHWKSVAMGAKEALEKHGQHQFGCPSSGITRVIKTFENLGECKCGLNEALAAYPPQGSGSGEGE